MKKILAFILATVMAFSMVACASTPTADEEETEAATTGETTAETTDSRTIALVLGYRQDEFYMDMEARFASYAKENNCELLVTDTNWDTAVAVAAIEDYTAMGVDAILTWGSDQLISAIDAAVDAGIPVVCYDGVCHSEKVTANVTYDPTADGTAIGEWVKNYISDTFAESETVEIAIIDYPASSEICVGRVNAFKAVIETIPNAVIVAQMDGKASRSDSMAAAETILEANPNVKIAYGINFDSVAGFYAALEGRGKTDCICVASGSWGEEAINFLVEDHAQYKAFTLMDPWAMAETTFQAALDALDGKTVEYDQSMTALVYDASNINQLDYKQIIASR